uniref:G_PROTEIN_RECEP_F1_2 domain-containing protein n=1 Tax=Caenorhabditis japonica TaxID=281687 RepID=A0A8R1HMI7_CAEJA
MGENITLTEDEQVLADQYYESLRIKLEVGILMFVFIVGGPMNIVALSNSMKQFMRTHKAKSQILLLRITLNIADLMTLFLYIPKQVIWLITYQWYGGEILCRVCAFFSTFSFYLNSFTIACIAIDRVFGAYNISSLNAHRKAYIRCRNLLGVGWIAAFLLSVPQALVFTTTSPYENVDFKQCATVFMIFLHQKSMEYNNPGTTEERRLQIDVEAENMQSWEKMYAINHFLFVFWIPCIIIVVSYVVVLLILQGHLKQESVSRPKSCFKFRVKSCDFDDSQSPTTRSPTRSTYLLQQEESYALRSNNSTNSRENLSGVPYEYEPQTTHHTRQGSIKSKASNGAGTKFGAMAVTTIHKAKQHAKKQAAFIIIAYLCFWSPYNFFTVLNLLGVPIMEELRHFLSFLNAGICINTVVNPIIYGVFQFGFNTKCKKRQSKTSST